MKNIISIILALTLTSSTFAQTGSLNQLGTIVDEFQYAMSVQWDQKDEAFAEASTKIFLTKAQAILAEKKLDPKELENFLEQRIGSKKTLEAMKLQIALNPNLTTSEFLELIRKNQSSFYSEGANWNGTGATLGLIGLIGGFVGLILLISWASGPGANCLRHEMQYYCYERFDLEGNMTRQDCRDHKVCAEYESYEPR